MNSFFYGNPNENDPQKPRIFPLLSSKLNPAITYKDCTFKFQQDKASTARQNLCEELNNPSIYTFEASFYGSQINGEKKHFSM